MTACHNPACTTQTIEELSAITDGRHAAIDLRFVRTLYENEPDNKLNALIDNVHRIWEQTKNMRYTRPDGIPYALPGAAQMIFSDLGTLAAEETRGFSAYRWIKDSLVARGVPSAQIAFMEDYKKSSAKQRRFNAVNGGQVRILMGSSETMGTGVNAQRRLKALHHLDVPWLPSQIEQREGRIERQGNENDEIARRVALQMIQNTIVCAPDGLRDQLRSLTRMQLVRTLASWRPDLTAYRDLDSAYRIGLKSLARRYLELHDEIADLDAMIAAIVDELAPNLIARNSIGHVGAAQLLLTAGDNPERLRSESSFASLCGVSPVPASSGKTVRHQLNRAANSALHIIAIGRLRTDQKTKDKEYVARRIAEGHSKLDAIRSLKRYIAREVFTLITQRASSSSGARLPRPNGRLARRRGPDLTWGASGQGVRFIRA